MAPLTRRQKAAADAVAAAAPVIDPADRLSKLPESILAEILSYLPGQEAVRTCVLARTWRHLWKFTTRLLITGDSVQEVRRFVDGLLRARLAGAGLVEVDGGGGGGGPIEVCEIRFDPFQDKDVPIVKRWIRLAVASRVQSLDIDMWRDEEDDDGDPDHYFGMSSRPLVSQHLTTLNLKGVCFRCEYLDFSGCPALERMEIHHSSMLDVSKMTSPSVRHLFMRYINCSQDYRFRICFPRLVSLRLQSVLDKNPVLESMPELVEADVIIVESSVADVHSSHSQSGTKDESDDCGGQNTTKCVLLDGLSQAQRLVLTTAYKQTNLFRRDLKWCPTFSKLKILVLNGHWCEPADCCALARILEHAPVLEELTVIFSHQCWSKYNVDIMGYLDAAAESNMMSPCLKIVKVKCGKVDEEVLNVLKYLGTLNIKFQIRV